MRENNQYNGNDINEANNDSYCVMYVSAGININESQRK